MQSERRQLKKIDRIEQIHQYQRERPAEDTLKS